MMHLVNYHKRLSYDHTADIDGGKIGCGYSENKLNIFYRTEDLDY